MIRREISSPGSPPRWALISQVEHARLSAELARHWRPPLVPVAASGEQAARVADEVRVELIEAIEHHDDGWAEWEEAPEIDAEHGRPRSFTEMSQADSLAIWAKSIAVAEQIGPLAAWVVAGHFLALLGDAEIEPVRQWTELMQARRIEWREAWLAAAPERTPDIADAALKVLQFFDAASLWFCCTCPAEEEALQATAESSLTFTNGRSFCFSATAAATADQDYQPGATTPQTLARITPWPLTTDHLRASAACVTAPQRRYLSATDLLAACRPHRLTWRLTT